MAKAIADIRSFARMHTRLAISTLAQVAAQKTAPPAARVSASVALLERGWGKPAADVQVSGEIKLTLRKMIEGDDALIIDATPEPNKIRDESGDASG